MSEFLLWCGKLLEFLGPGGSVPLLLALVTVLGVRVVRSGSRGVYFLCGVARKEVQPGIHWRPFPLYRLAVQFCGDQIKDLKGQEVVTKDGITCRVEGSISYQVSDLKALVTTVYDADEQLLWEIMAEIREWVTAHSYEECIGTELGKKIVPSAVRRACRWGVKVLDVNIVTFAPANPEARALVFLLDVARRRAQSAALLVGALEELHARWQTMGVSPSVLLAALAGLPVSVVSGADQWGVIREELAGLPERVAERIQPSETFGERVVSSLAGHVPGLDTLLALKDRSGDSRV